MVARVTLEIALRREFDYAIPPELAGRLEVGSRVKVPFGRREVPGVVTALLEESSHGALKPILKVLGRQSLVTPRILALARWIADYYCCPVEIALKSVLPDAVRQEEEGWRERLHVRVAPGAAGAAEPPKLTPRQRDVWRVLEEWRDLPLQELLRLTGCTADLVRRLEDKGLVSIAPEISERDPYAHETILPTQPLSLNPSQAGALQAVVAAMDGLRGGDAPGARPAFLLHGVTGSGKTEVYLQAIAHALEQGRGAIVLVPEISLTPQTVERFKARFSSGPLQTLVAVLHSHLSGGERHDEWHKIRQGRARIVIGARSAIFAPVDPLGLIIVDEEHEHSYKQEESPRYHARDVAVVRAQMEGAVCVLGSATPSMESYYNAQRGKYTLLEMPTRVDDQKLPVVRVVDLRAENRKRKGAQIFSEQLKEAMTRRLERREQTILFLNRRGWSSSLQCPQCGYVAECPNCSVSLTYHRAAQRLLCHICAYTAPAPRQCPQPTCRNPAIRYTGLGTERVEDTLHKLFPQAVVRRMDSDVLKRKDDFRRILGDFRAGKIDILVGTQMIAKGLHFPNVTLVGIVYADISLHIADFRAGERTFQLLTQVAGRAGRGDVEGEVFVQAFTPFHPAIQYARRHDYAGFYEQELEFRQQLKYPPFSRIALLVIKGRNEEKVQLSSEHVRARLEALVPRAAGAPGPPAAGPAAGVPAPAELLLGDWAARPAPAPAQAPAAPAVTAPIPDLILMGPAPAPLARAETFYRYQIMARTRQMSLLSRHLSALVQSLDLPEDITLTVDIDPVDLA
ncbi:MAG: primosomal protein [Verrucomicrobiota bacterium]|jgi:primosomal protein N' (replication factor Y)